MRWIWIDRFEKFESGKEAWAVKNVTLAEEHLHDHFPGWPVMPASLVVEGMAQTAGILVGEARGFKEKVILAKVSRATFFDHALPGDQLKYQATVISIENEFARTEGKVWKDGKVMAEIEILFSHIDNNLGGRKFPEENFVFTDQFRQILQTIELTKKEEKS
ncbi:MAG: beta-hydroxyacyl-ACP dehydratase [Phycisphaerae bacterium]|jgi:3-hydroxyacyl-[acyl-carrier-protein] dehydratase|nr:beta-hydroxyacyl-ACP dehydratase [Phycisphaerae bacterium]